MNRNIVNNLKEPFKANKLITNFLKEIRNSLNNEGIDDFKMNTNNKLITEYRDKLKVERMNILNNYSLQHLDKPNLLYIYDVNSKDDSIFNLCYCDKTKSHEIVELNRLDMPNNAEIGTIVRNYDGRYILDEQATIEITSQMESLYKDMLQQQEDYLSSKRINGHEYEVSEVAEDRVWLFDITENANEAIEEIKIEDNLLRDLKEGDILKYIDEDYIKT